MWSGIWYRNFSSSAFSSIAKAEYFLMKSTLSFANKWGGRISGKFYPVKAGLPDPSNLLDALPSELFAQTHEVQKESHTCIVPPPLFDPALDHRLLCQASFPTLVCQPSRPENFPKVRAVEKQFLTLWATSSKLTQGNLGSEGLPPV